MTVSVMVVPTVSPVRPVSLAVMSATSLEPGLTNSTTHGLAAVPDPLTDTSVMLESFSSSDLIPR